MDLPDRKAADYEGADRHWQEFRHICLRPGLLIMSDPLKPLFGGPGGALEQLARRAAEVDALTALVRRPLPDPLGPHVTASTRHGGRPGSSRSTRRLTGGARTLRGATLRSSAWRGSRSAGRRPGLGCGRSTGRLTAPGAQAVRPLRRTRSARPAASRTSLLPRPIRPAAACAAAGC